MAAVKFKIRSEFPDEAKIIDQVYFKNCYEIPDDMTDKWFVDIGANVGAASLLALGRGAWVRAFEPAERERAAFLENEEANAILFRSKAELIAAAVGGKEGTLRLYVSKNNSGGNCAYPHLIGDLSDRIIQDVPVVTIEKAIEGIDRVAFLKMDCEGAEFEILPAIWAGLWKRIDRMAIEFHGASGKAVSETMRYYHAKRVATGEWLFWKEGR